MSLRLTHSQRELFALARTAPAEGFAVDLVKIDAPHIGVSYAARQAHRETRLETGAPYSLHLMAPSLWDAEMSLVRIAGKGCWGSGHLDIMHRCIERLGAQSGRALCLWLDRAGRMSTNDQDDFAARAEYMARKLGVALRLLYLIQRITVWHNVEQRMVRGFVTSAFLEKSAETWQFGGDGLQGILAAEDDGAGSAVPGALIQQPHQVKIA